MSKQINIQATFNNEADNVNVKVVVLYFMEKDVHIVYSPHLDVSGYGKTEADAKSSFNLCLGEFLDYSTKKKSLHNELVKLGWTLKSGTAKKPRKIVAPSFDELIQQSESLKEIVNTRNFSKSLKQVSIPV